MILTTFMPVFWLINLHRQKNGPTNQGNHTVVILQNKLPQMKNWKSTSGIDYNVQIKKALAVESEQLRLDS